jgi:beta-lactamase regulating signal transducer with metallopeptidase domain
MTAGFGVVAMFGMQAMAESAALRIVDCLFAGTLIALLAGIVSRFSRRQSSSLQFAMWFSALIALTASPFLGDAILAVPQPSTSSGMTGAPIILPGSWALYIFYLWAALASLFLLRVGIGLWRLHALRKTFIPVDLNELDESVRDTLRCGVSRASLLLFTSERVQVPAAIGLIKPVVVVPRWAIDELSADELKHVLLHEVAHVRRRDSWTNLVQQLVKAVLFFHPAVWWIERRMSLEREVACDDAVLAETASPRAYAECLKHLAERSFLRRSLALAQAVLGQVRQTSMRVARILDASHARGANHRWRTAFSVVVLLIVCGLIRVNEPHLIAFQNIAPQAISDPSHVSAITPVSLKTAEAVATCSGTHSSPAHELAVRRNANRRPAPSLTKKSELVMAAAKSDPNIVHFATGRAIAAHRPRVMVSESVLVVFETRSFAPSGQPTYEIEVVHLTVMRIPASPASNEILHKEI